MLLEQVCNLHLIFFLKKNKKFKHILFLDISRARDLLVELIRQSGVYVASDAAHERLAKIRREGKRRTRVEFDFKNLHITIVVHNLIISQYIFNFFFEKNFCI